MMMEKSSKEDDPESSLLTSLDDLPPEKDVGINWAISTYLRIKPMMPDEAELETTKVKLQGKELDLKLCLYLEF